MLMGIEQNNLVSIATDGCFGSARQYYEGHVASLADSFMWNAYSHRQQLLIKYWSITIVSNQ